MVELSRRQIVTIGALSMAGLLSARGAQSKNTIRAQHATPSETPEDFRETSARFGLDLLLELARLDNAETNFAVSPASVLAVFSLADIGASPAFHAALQKTFHLGGGKDTGLAALRRSLALLFDDRHSQTPLSGVDALYVDQGVELKTGALDAVKTLHARIESRRLADPAVVDEINALVRDRTKGEIPTIIDGSLEGAGLVLVNALYFKDTWESPFNKDATQDWDFQLVGGRTSRVRMMHADARSLPSAETGAFAAVQLPYNTDGYSLIVVVNREKPAQPLDFAPVAAWLTGSGLTQRQARVSLPRFGFKGGTDILPALDALGLGPARAAPGALAGFSDSALQISKVPHKVAIAVDEGGTTAAAATAIAIPTSAPPSPGKVSVLEFVADKPFMFALRDDKAGLALMIGYVGDPTKTA